MSLTELVKAYSDAYGTTPQKVDNAWIISTPDGEIPMWWDGRKIKIEARGRSIFAEEQDDDTELEGLFGALEDVLRRAVDKKDQTDTVFNAKCSSLDWMMPKLLTSCRVYVPKAGSYPSFNEFGVTFTMKTIIETPAGLTRRFILYPSGTCGTNIDPIP